uniref:Predicted nucleotide-binding protein containing TIR-like domain-containing protein n=1 Tax=Candidatus Kentrum sp. LFY TaxID=2126342 RepID=A0A450V084_9GAMM|nr:MAG: Predicted nucleotide-binding protein containing TIR-like domain-containing protein [Candidatus Kentron sp. LFY]
MGYFLGRLGQRRVCALKKGDVEEPSDYRGVLYISMDMEDWRMKLVGEIKSAGFDVDVNRVFR